MAQVIWDWAKDMYKRGQDSLACRILFCLAVLSLSLCPAWAADPVAPPAAPAAAPAPALSNAPGITNATGADKFLVNKVIYEYRSAHMRDPFKSLFRSVKGSPEECPECPPIEKFDLVQMKLLAVVVEGGKGYALVRPPDNKHYMIQLGTRIGIHEGVVIKIEPDKVIIKEKMINYKNEIEIVNSEMKLREEAPK